MSDEAGGEGRPRPVAPEEMLGRMERLEEELGRQDRLLRGNGETGLRGELQHLLARVDALQGQMRWLAALIAAIAAALVRVVLHP